MKSTLTAPAATKKPRRKAVKEIAIDVGGVTMLQALDEQGQVLGEWEPRSVIRHKPNYAPFQGMYGLSIESMKKAKCKVAVTHLRVVFEGPEFNGEGPKPFQAARVGARVRVPTRKMEFTELMVPSYLRKQFNFDPRGGQTYVTIQKEGMEPITLVSRCPDGHNFCYKLGIKTCLERLNEKEIKQILG